MDSGQRSLRASSPAANAPASPRISDRQRLILRKVVERHLVSGEPVGSKWIAGEPDVPWGPSTVRAELHRLEQLGLLQHPHTSAGRVPTDRGYRVYVDDLLTSGGLPVSPVAEITLPAVRRELDQAIRQATTQLSQITNLLALVTAPPIETTTVRRVEVLQLQPQLVMVVVITSTGGVTKRVFTYPAPVDPGLVEWAESYLNETLHGLEVGARMLRKRLDDPELDEREREFLRSLAPVFTELEESAQSTLFMEGAHRLLAEHRFFELSQIADLLGILERRVLLLGLLRRWLDEPSVYLRIGSENPAPEMRSMSLVAANYGTPLRNLGTVSVLGPVRMDYARAIAAVRATARELSRFVGEVYER